MRCVVMSWPVINPLGRYRHAKRVQAGANAPDWRATRSRPCGVTVSTTWRRSDAWASRVTRCQASAARR